jgi:multiple sugar transport system substrate-binding protein
MNPDILRLGQYQDNLYGLSYWAGCYSLIYNIEHFAEAGLDATDGPSTIAELDILAETLTQRRDDGNIDRMGFLPEGGTFWLWATVFGGNFFDYKNQQITANDPNIVEALEWYASYAEKYGAANVAAFTEGLASERAQQLDPLISGTYSIQAQGPWKLGDIHKFAENFEYNVVPPPRETKGAPLSNWTWGDIQVIPNGSKDPSAAAEFVLFTAGVNDPEGYAERVVWGNRPINIPVSPQVLEYPAFQEVVANYPGFQTFIDSLLNADNVGSPPVMPAAAFYENRMTAAIEAVMLQVTEPQEALDSLNEEVQRQLDR